MAITLSSLPYPTREISNDFRAFLAEIGAQSFPVSIATNNQTLLAQEGDSYHIISGTGSTVTITDPSSNITNGDFYTVTNIAGSNIIIGGVTFTNISPVEILRIYLNGVWQTINTIPPITDSTTEPDGNSTGFFIRYNGQIYGNHGTNAAPAWHKVIKGGNEGFVVTNNSSPTKIFNAKAADIDTLYSVVATLIQTLQTKGVI